MPAEPLIASITAEAEAVIRRVMLALADELRDRIRELDTKDGRFVRDQGRVTVALSRQVRAYTANRVPDVISTITARLTDLVEETLADHPELGRYTPEIAEDLIRTFRGGAAEVAAAITDGGADAVSHAVERVVLAGARVEDAAGPVARAMETTTRRATTAVERAVREFHEQGIKRMGARAGGLVYLYAGPGEGSPNIRDYCRARTGRVLTQEQVDALEPRERFNCRHGIAPLSAEDAVGRPRFEG